MGALGGDQELFGAKEGHKEGYLVTDNVFVVVFGVERAIIGGDITKRTGTILDVHGFCSYIQAEGCEGKRDGGFLPVVSKAWRSATQGVVAASPVSPVLECCARISGRLDGGVSSVACVYPAHA